MEILIYILAAIGGLTVLSALLTVFIILATNKEQVNEPHRVMCSFTMGDCIYREKEGENQCDGCPVAEEAAKIGDR